MRRWTWTLVLQAALLSGHMLAACGEGDSAGEIGPPERSEGLLACINDGVDGQAHEGMRCLTHRAIGGVSMGGGSAARIALQHPELFDVISTLGAPYIDFEYFLFSVAEASNGGFCSMEQILAHLDNVDVKDDPDLWCGPNQVEDLAVPDTDCVGFSGDFNHHYRGTDAGRGGSFNRKGSFEIVQDLALAYGNPAFYNPDSPYMPPGVPESYHVDLDLLDPDRRDERQAAEAEICSHPFKLEGFYDRMYNPTGEYPVITFCDGDGPESGQYEPGVADFPVEVVLAVDYNNNGRRDFAEPVIAHPLEYYEDFGTDGVEGGNDVYDWYQNPTGTEGNFRFDEGEHFDDFGLDGVPNTGDYGEGTGKWELNPSIENAFAQSPRRILEQMDEHMLGRLHIWADAGIRDFLFTAQITNQFWGALRLRSSDTKLILDWSELAQVVGQTEYDPYTADLSQETLGRHAYLRYGDVSVCPDVDWEEGRGNHVGPPWEILQRLLTALAFASARWEGGDFTALNGSLADQGGPTGSLSDFLVVESYDSEALGRPQPYVVILPPDYYLKGEASYPVMYFLHGQGQKATDLAASALLFLTPQMESKDPDRVRARRSDWQKMIIVFADGECHPGECHTGTFYTDFVGMDGHGARHGEAFFELMRVIDEKYRTKDPSMTGP